MIEFVPDLEVLVAQGLVEALDPGGLAGQRLLLLRLQRTKERSE